MGRHIPSMVARASSTSDPFNHVNASRGTQIPAQACSGGQPAPVELPAGMQDGRSGQLQVVVGTPRDAHLTTRYADPVGDREFVPGSPRRRHGHGARAGPAGPCLPGAALVDPHVDVVRPTPYDELDIHAVWKGVLGRPARLVSEVSGLAEVVDERDGVRVAHVDVYRRPLLSGRLDDDPGGLRELRLTHVDGQRAVVVQYDVLHAGASTDPDRLVAGQPGFGEVADEDPDAVAAHLRDRTVRVAVVHEPVATVLDVRLPVTLDHPQDAVGAETRVPVAEELHEPGIE